MQNRASADQREMPRLITGNEGVDNQVFKMKTWLDKNPNATISASRLCTILAALKSAHHKTIKSMQREIDRVQSIAFNNRLALDRILHLQVFDIDKRNTENLINAQTIAAESLGPLERETRRKTIKDGD